MDLTTLFPDISKGEKEAFNALFRQWYPRLLNFAGHYLNNQAEAEETVSDVFIALWQNKSSLIDIANPESYLYVSVKNRCLNMLRSRNIQNVSIDEQPYLNYYMADSVHETIEHQELYTKLNELVETLPEQRKLIFKMIKEDELTAKQTSEILNISIRTVENQIYKAVKTLETEITAYLGYSPRKLRNPQARNIVMMFLM